MTLEISKPFIEIETVEQIKKGLPFAIGDTVYLLPFTIDDDNETFIKILPDCSMGFCEKREIEVLLDRQPGIYVKPVEMRFALENDIEL